MKKISIVGVEGSGKTVLMTALGNKYENPDDYGIFLSPENPDAFSYVKLQMDRMRHGQWPGNTIAGQSSVLEWGLFQRQGNERKRLCDLSFLDFSGEVYRLAFGSKNDHDSTTYEDLETGIQTLKEHISASDTLIVLINLKDIISGDIADARTRESMWLSKGIIDYATRELQLPHIALVFTQSDLFRLTLNECGGIKGAYEKYLPHVSNIYPDLPLFAVSAVNKTYQDNDGIPCPAEGFDSEGLDSLMEWIVSNVPGCETLISTAKNALLAPAKLLDKANQIEEEYKRLFCDEVRRKNALRTLEQTCEQLNNAINAAPKAEVDHNAVLCIYEKLSEYHELEQRIDSVMKQSKHSDDTTIRTKVLNLCKQYPLADEYRDSLITQAQSIRINTIQQAIDSRKQTRFVVIVLIVLLALGMAWLIANKYEEHVKRQRKFEKVEKLRSEMQESRRRQEWKDVIRTADLILDIEDDSQASEYREEAEGELAKKAKQQKIQVLMLAIKQALQNDSLSRVVELADSILAIEKGNSEAMEYKKNAQKEIARREEERQKEIARREEERQKEIARQKIEKVKFAYRENHYGDTITKVNAFLSDTWLTDISEIISMRDEAKRYREMAIEGFNKTWDSLKGVLTLPYGVKLKVLPCNPGTFVMGSTSFERSKYDCEDRKEPRHTVKLTQKFWLGESEVTQGQYEALMGNNPATKIKIDAQFPVNGVTWKDAMAFCNKLNDRYKDQLPYGYEISLPSEAQWEYAARAGTTTTFWWGNNQGDGLGKFEAVPYDYDGSNVWKVMSGKNNPWGFFDMLSNVSEWCIDSNYNWGTEDRTDPILVSSFEWKVCRGGNCWFNEGYIRCAHRTTRKMDESTWSVLNSDERRPCIGFRIAVVPKRKSE